MGKYFCRGGFEQSPRRRWYLVANRAEARIYQDRPKHGFEFVQRMENPEGKMSESELDSDRPGRSFSSARGASISHSLDQTAIRHETVAKRFAAMLAKVLESSVREGKFSELVLVAEPHFLGLLRAAIPASVRDRIGHEINREFAQGSDLALRDYLREKLQSAY